MLYDRGRAESSISSMSLEPSPNELADWMNRTCRGDAAALELLFRATPRWLVAIAYNYMQSSADAEDVVEELFLKLWIRRDRIRVTGSVKSYLSTAVRNTAFNHLDRRRVETRYTESHHREPWVGGGTTEDAVRPAIDPEDMEQVRQAIDRLPPRARETYCLYYYRGLTYSQIAQAMGVSVRTVEAQLVRCVRRLTKELREVLG